MEENGSPQNPSGQTDQLLDMFRYCRQARLFWTGRRFTRPGSSSSSRSITQMNSTTVPPTASLSSFLIIEAAKYAAHVVFGVAQNSRRHVEAPFNAVQEIEFLVCSVKPELPSATRERGRQ
jgi:hypothetical protein